MATNASVIEVAYINATTFSNAILIGPIKDEIVVSPAVLTLLHSKTSTIWFRLRGFASLILLYLVCTAIFTTFRTYRFRRFAKRNKCAPPVTIPNVSSFQHKKQRLRFKGDLLDDVVCPKFITYGPTHALVDPITNRMKVLWTVEPANIDALLSSKSVDYFRSPRLLKAGTPFLGPGLGTTSDHVWARHRQTVKPILDRHHQKDIAFYDKHLDRFFNALGIDGEWTQLQDLNDLLGFFTMDTSTEYFFGANTNSFVSKKIRQDVSIWTMLWHLVTNRTTHRWSKPLDGEALLAEFGHAFDETMKYVQGRYLMGKMYWLVDSWKFRVSCWKVNAAIDYFVDRAARKIVTGVADQSSDTKRYGLLEEILKGNSGNLIDVRDQVMHILIAGRDTTQSALSWAFALLGNNPSVFLRLRNEVLEHFGPEDDPKEEITFSTLRSCKYLQYTIKEVLRLYSSVQQPRETRVDTVLPVGGGADGTNPLAIPAGTTIMAPQYVLHRRTDHWGSDSGEFRPERWETKKLKAREYLPFSAGAHSCLGQQYAITEMSLLLLHTIRRFSEVRVPEGQNNLVKGKRATLSPAQVIVQFRRS